MSLLAVAAVTATLVGASFVEVRSNTNCPSAQVVTARLTPMLPEGWRPGPLGDIATIDFVEGRPDAVAMLRLRLFRVDGSVGGDRRLLLQGGCDEMADAVATVIAAWETDFVSAPAPAPAPEPAPARGPAPTAMPAPEPSAPAPQPAVPALVAASPPAGEGVGAPARMGLSLGASLGVALVGDVAAAAGLEVAGGGEASFWQLRLAATFQTARQMDLEPGSVSWRHTALAAGIRLRSLGPRWRLSADAGPLLGWATLDGQGYAENRGQSALEYGAGAGLRAERVWGRFALWLEARTTVWSERQTAMLTGSSQSAALPIADVMFSVGGSATYFR